MSILNLVAPTELLARAAAWLHASRARRQLRRRQWQRYQLLMTLDPHLLRDLGWERDRVTSLLLDPPEPDVPQESCLHLGIARPFELTHAACLAANDAARAVA